MTKPEAPSDSDSPLPLHGDELSRIRSRPRLASGELEKPRLDSSRPQRLARAMRFAQLILEMLPPQDSARGLLDLAIRRRDEALLDAILKDLHRQQQLQREAQLTDGARRRD